MKRIERTAVDDKGKILPLSQAEIAEVQNKLMREGNLIAAVMELNGEMSIQVFEAPSTRVCEALEVAARAIRKALEGH